LFYITVGAGTGMQREQLFPQQNYWGSK